jgi:excisionase family DNA binding protein
MATAKHKAALIKQLLALIAEEKKAPTPRKKAPARPSRKKAPAPLADPRNSFTITEIAQRNGFGRAYIYLEVERGNLQAYRPGGTGHMRVTPQQEAEWLARKQAPVPVAPKNATGKSEDEPIRKSTRQQAARPRAT